MTARDHVILSDDDEEGGNLEAEDTELHFGGAGLGRSGGGVGNPYGPQSSGPADMAEVYSQRKTELGRFDSASENDQGGAHEKQGVPGGSL